MSRLEQASTSSADRPDRRLKVFVHLARDKDARQWRAAYEAGTLIGLNEETPYGYGRAEHMGCDVAFSKSEPEGLFAKASRLSLRVALGFDVVHAYRQKDAMGNADVVWTHTESQFLAVAWLLRNRPDRPRLLAQSVWLFDRWPRIGPLHRALYRWLMQTADVLTVLSPENLAIARTLLPQKRVELVTFGVPSEAWAEPTPRPCVPVRVLALGNDRHRAWATLVQAARGQAGIELAILSSTASPRLACDSQNISVSTVTSNAELRKQLAEATVMCVPLIENKHASGITVIQEAVLAGLPVIATDTGGLRSYFGPEHIRYVPVGDAAALREALLEAARHPEQMVSMARRAQKHMLSTDMGAESFIRRHVELSRELTQDHALSRTAQPGFRITSASQSERRSRIASVQ